MNTVENETRLGSQRWRDIVDMTIEEVRRQRRLPNSPCAPGQGRMLWCAGALLVRAALRILRSPAAARAFERALVRTGDKNLIVATARAIGLPADLVAQAVVQNDRHQPTRRTSGMIHFLRELRMRRISTPASLIRAGAAS